MKKTGVGANARFTIPKNWEDLYDSHKWGDTLLDMDSDDPRLRPRINRRPVDIDETLMRIFQDAGKPLSIEEIIQAWGRLRSQRKTTSLAGDMTAIINAQGKRDKRNAKRACVHYSNQGYANAAQ